MAPPKSSRGAHDSDAPTGNGKERSGQQNASGAPHGHAKLRRVASSTGPNLGRESAASSTPGAPATNGSGAAPAQDASQQGIQWSTVPRDVLHAYRRHHHLATPTCFASSSTRWVLSTQEGLGAYSPTMARRRVAAASGSGSGAAPAASAPGGGAATAASTPATSNPAGISKSGGGLGGTGGERRQTRDQLAAAVRRHFSAAGVPSENDAVAAFLHKARLGKMGRSGDSGGQSDTKWREGRVAGGGAEGVAGR